MDKPWKVILAFVGVFMSGAIFGGLFTLRASAKRFASELESSRASVPAPTVAVKEAPVTPPATQPPATTTTQAAAQPVAKAAPTSQDRVVTIQMRQLVQRLNPTSEQQKMMRTIVGRMNDDFRRLERELWQDTTRVTERMYEDLGTILTPEQRTLLEKMRQEMLEKVRAAKEKQRLEQQARAAARPIPANQPANSNRKPGAPEAANPGP